MKNFVKLTLAIVCFLIIPVISFSQATNNKIDHHHEHKGASGQNIDRFKLPLEFDADSLIGFDEAAAMEQARIRYSEAWQQERLVAVLKRNYINFHHNLKRSAPTDPTVQAPCTNADFETGTLAGWNAEESDNNNSLTMLPWNAGPTTQAVIMNAGGFDANLGGTVLPVVPPGGGSYSCRLGQTGIGGTSYRLSQTFNVTALNSVFIYRYAVVLEDGSHECNEQPFFNVSFKTCNNVAIPCAQYNVVTDGDLCTTGGDPNFITSGAYKYLPWQTRSFDLTSYIGQCVNIEFTVGGCVITQGAHAGYAYIDAQCQPMTLNLNGVDIPVGQTTSNMCVASTNTLCAPIGFTSYSWTGPGVTGQTNRCITTSTGGSYSVTLGMAGSSCQSPVLYSAFTLVPKPIADFNFVTTPCQSTFTVPFTDNSNLNGGPAISNYWWDFNNDGTPDNTTANTSNDFLASGTYTTELKISNGGCVDSIAKVITITAAPQANFNTSSACLNVVTNFTSTATPTVGLTHTWDFGAGALSGGPNMSYTYTSSGTKNVTYTVSNGACTSTITKTLTISPNPVAALSANTVCLGAPTVFGNTSSVTSPDAINAWAWDFDNNGTVDDITQLPTTTYTASGIFNAELKVTTNNGCQDSLVIPVKVNAIPTASFTPANACTNSNVGLVNTSSATAPDVVSTYTWTFAGGTPGNSNQQNPPVLAYGISGQKSITLAVTATSGCTATVTQTVDIYPQPIANFSTTSVCQSIATAFTDLSTTTVGTITNWAWDFTNNNSIDNTTNAPANIYPSSGTPTAALIVTSSNGCKDTVALPVNVWGHTIPDFTPDKVCFGTNSTFINQTNETTNSNVGTGSTYNWDFADGTNSNQTNPVHAYSSGGNVNATYNVTLTATSLHGCVDYTVKPVSVYAVPTASFTSDSVCLGSPSHMIDASNGNGNMINGYVWDFLNNGTDISGVPNPNYTFPSYGNNIVSYTVSTSPVTGLICSNVTNTITVWVNPNPVPDFTFVNNCVNAQPNTFDGSPSTIAIGTNASYAWAFGDGISSTPLPQATTTHNYSTAGVYNVILTVTSSKGCQTAVNKQVEVFEKPRMIISNINPCEQTAMTFTAVTQSNSGNVVNWYWDTNNSINSIEATGQTSSYLFSTPGSHTLTLISQTDHGCNDTLRKPVYVNYMPSPQFIGDKLSGCPKHCVNFTDLTPLVTGPAQIVNWQWNLGDGRTVNNLTNTGVAHCYNNTSSNQLATFDIALTVRTDSGCVSTNTKPSYITVYPTPIAAYAVNPNPGNILTPLEYFTNQSVDYVKWWWSFGDGPFNSDSVNVDPTHFYSDETAQTYNTHLIVMNQYGCADTASVLVEIGPEFTFYIPNAFTPSNDDGINDYFTGKGIGIAHYEMWIFDRWGERIFYTDDIAKGWDGRVQGKSTEGKQDVYTWKVKLQDVLGKKHEYIGHVTLLK